MRTDYIEKEISCKDDFDPGSLDADIARQKIIDAIRPVADTEILPLRESIGRILGQEILSPLDVPSGTNSAMDGYAVSGDDIPESGTRELKLVGTTMAGQPLNKVVKPGECVRIMTGAIMPEGTDTVIMQEHVQQTGDSVLIDHTTGKGANVRQAGEDIAINDRVFSSGIRLTPAEIGVIASLGIGKVKVVRKIKVAFFSTGDELRSIGETLESGQIYDSNRYSLYGMLIRLGAEIIDLGVVRDERMALKKALESAAEQADVVITSGGVSVGEADYVKEMLESIGEINFWKVAMKPGRPLAFGHINNTLFFGLPGNPVSVMVTFYQFVQPALRYLMGEDDIDTQTFKVRCKSKLKKRPGRVEYQRGILQRDDNGELVVYKTGAQGSGILRSMAQANCFIILPMESDTVMPDSLVDVQPFFGLV
jgi:molybdopterin molybdotransferase